MTDNAKNKKQSFTNKDLKRVKETYSGKAITIPVKNGFVDGWALLARLEAAEQVCRNINLFQEPRTGTGIALHIQISGHERTAEWWADQDTIAGYAYQGFREKLEAWRKAAGR